MSLNPTELTGIPFLDYDDFMRGKTALVYYHNAMVTLYPQKYKLDLQSLIRGLTAREKNKYFVDGLGLGILNAEATDKTVRNAMEYLASKGGGNVPASNNTFFQSIANQVTADIKFTDISSFVVLETAKDVLVGVSKVGEKIIDGGEAALDTSVSLIKSLKWVLPVVVIGGVFTYVYLMPKAGFRFKPGKG